VLEKLFLLRLLDRLPRWTANAFAFAVVMVGWTLFRAGSLQQAGEFLSAMVQPGLATGTAPIFITPDMTTAAAIAAFVCILPRLPGFDRLRVWVVGREWRSTAVQTGISLLFIVAVGKAVADPFTPFIYFRF
jgi:alginate O-acetyltransferase complex protein AlgI